MLNQNPSTTSGMFNPEDLQSGKKLLDGQDIETLRNWSMGSSYGNTALSGGGAAGAPIANANIYVVETVAAGADSIALPFGVAGLTVRVFNQTTTSLTLWPQPAVNPATGVVDVLHSAANSAITNQAIAGAASISYFCLKPGLWKSSS